MFRRDEDRRPPRHLRDSRCFRKPPRAGEFGGDRGPSSSIHQDAHGGAGGAVRDEAMTKRHLRRHHRRVSSTLVATLLGLLALGVAVAAGSIVRQLAAELAADPRLPLWDGAKYGVDGLRLAQAIAALDLPEATRWLYGMDVWGPVFPLAEAAVFLATGESGYEVPRRLEIFLFVLLIAATALAGLALERSRAERSCAGTGTAIGVGVGLLAASLVATSPTIAVFATLVMLEIPGALLAVLAFACWCRAERSGRVADWRLAWLATLLLVFTKTNYAALWLAPMLLVEATTAAGGGRRLLSAGARRLRRVRWRRPFMALNVLWLVGLAAIVVAGGVDLRLGDLRLRASSLGNPLYGLYLLWVGRLLVLRARRGGRFAWGRIVVRWRRLPARWRSFARWVLLPLAVWLLLPPHLKETVGFLENRDSGIARWSLEGLLFYPRAVAHDYAATPALGWAVLGLAMLLAVRWRRLGRSRRLLALVAVGGLVAAAGHDYKLPRFLFTVAPFLFLAAATQAGDLLAGAARRLGRGGARRRWRAEAAVALLLALLALVVVARGVDGERLRRERRSRTAAPAAQAVLEALGRLDGPLVVLGTWNDLSPGLVEWHLRRGEGRAAGDRLVADAAAAMRRQDPRRLRELVAGLPPGASVVIVAAVDPGLRPRWLAEIGSRRELFAELARNPGLQRAAAPDTAGSGYRLRRFIRRADPPARDPRADG